MSEDVTFVVWAQIERVEHKQDRYIYDNVGLPDSLYETNDADDARAFMELLQTFDVDEQAAAISQAPKPTENTVPQGP